LGPGQTKKTGDEEPITKEPYKENLRGVGKSSPARKDLSCQKTKTPLETYQGRRKYTSIVKGGMGGRTKGCTLIDSKKSSKAVFG